MDENITATELAMMAKEWKDTSEAFDRVIQVIEDMRAWGCHAKSTLGEFMPEELANRARDAIITM